MLSPGTKLGSYEISTQIGVGGMGEVYRATDTNLKRQVAIKVLLDLVAADAERVARFQREAEVLAALNHPNIAHIHGLERSAGTIALVMELVEGPTLADRIAQGPIPVDEALPIAKQIAEALETAHEQGIIHRDLKPANIKVRAEGTVKVLDFGLAKAFDPSPAARDVSLSPTMTSPAMTRTGVILGTAAYMSPEQARGLAVDARADIWAFGVVLYEMLTGGTLFEGATVTDTLAAVLRADVDLTRLPTDLPAGVRTLIGRCLQREQKRRLQHIGDARIEIEDLQSSRNERPETGARPNRWRLAVLSAALAAAIVSPVVWLLKPSTPAPVSAPTRFIVRVPYDLAGPRMSVLDLSPDGSQLVYAASVNAKIQLFQQSFDAFTTHPLLGTEGAFSPFFSPKGDAVGFWAQSVGQLKAMSLSGGSATRLVDAPESTGSDWGEDGTLVFSPGWGRALHVLRPSSARPETLTQLDTSRGEGAHLWPHVLPEARAALFTIWAGAPTWDEAAVAVVDLATGQHRIVLRGGASARYASSGHVVFWRGNSLMAAPFDLATLEVTGDAVRVVPQVRLDNFSGAAHFALSRNGTLAYVSGTRDTFTENVVVDRSGRVVGRFDDPIPGGGLSFSPDGAKVAMLLYTGGTFGVGVYDLKRRLQMRLPVAADTATVTWSVRGDRVMFLANSTGQYAHYSIPSDGSGQAEPLFTGTQSFSPSRPEWSSDGRHFVFSRPDAKTGSDIWMYTPGNKLTPAPLLAGPANESSPTLSPDGRFIAYQSDESGVTEVYVRPFPDVEASRVMISRAGGDLPKWSRDGREIFYSSEKGIMGVPVLKGSANGSPSFREPSVVLAISGLRSYDASPDGRTFAVERTPTEKAANEIHVIVNWFDELTRLVPR